MVDPPNPVETQQKMVGLKWARIGAEELRADTTTTNRKLPRSDPAAQSRLNVPSLVLPSTLSRRDDLNDQRPVPPLVSLLSRRARRRRLLPRAQRRPRRQRVLQVPPRDKLRKSASKEQRVHQ